MLRADRIILKFKLYESDGLFEFGSIVNCFILFSNLHVIVSEFYDLDVGTVNKIEIKAKRIPSAFSGSGPWNLREVT